MEMKKGYKQTEVGVIPEDWEVKPVLAVAPLQRGFDLPTLQLKNGSYPVVYSNGILNYHNKPMVAGPGVVTGRSGTIGKVNYIEENYWPHNTTLWVTNFKGNHPKFIYYIYQHIKLERFGTGSGVPTLNRNDVHAFRIPLPPLPEQTAIAAALSNADALISSLEKLIAKKRNIKQGAMQQLLTGKKRLPGFSGEWEVKSLNTISSSVVSGKSKNKSETGTFTVFGSTGIIGFNSSYDYEGQKILVARVGANAGITNIVDGKYCVSDNTLIVDLKKDTDFLFVFYFLKHSNLNKLIFGSGQPLITGNQLKNLNIPIHLTKAEQAAIAQILSDIDVEIEQLEQKLAKYRMIKQGMMQELLTGRIRLV